MFIIEDPYVLSGFMALQIAIEKSFVEIWTNPALPKIADDVSSSNTKISDVVKIILNEKSVIKSQNQQKQTFFAADYRPISVLQSGFFNSAICYST